MSSLSYNESMNALGGRLPGGSIMNVPSYGGRGMGSFSSAQAAYEQDVASVAKIDGQIRGVLDRMKSAQAKFRNFAFNIEQQYGQFGFRIKGLASQAVDLSGDIGNMLADSESEYRAIRSEFDSANTSLQNLAAASPTPGNTNGWPPYFQSALSQIQTRARDLDTYEGELRNIEMQIEQLVEVESKKLRDEQARLAAIDREQQSAAQAAANQAAQIAAQQQSAQMASASQAAAQAAAAAAQAEAQAQSSMFSAESAATIELARIQAEQARLAREDARISEERTLRLQLEQQRMTSDQAMQDMMMQLEIQRMDREAAQADKSSERRDDRDRLALILELAGKGLIAKEAAGQAIAQAVGVNYQAPVQAYQGGPVPPGFQLVDDQTGQVVQAGAGGYQQQGYVPPAPAFNQFPYQAQRQSAPPPPPVAAPAAPAQIINQPAFTGIPGLEYGSFAPGAELFGMGGMGASAFSLPAGATVAPGYAISQLESGDYQATTPDGRTFSMTDVQVKSPGRNVADPKTGVVFYTTPAEAGVVDSIANFFGKVAVPVGLTAGDAFMRAKRGESLIAPQAPPAQQGGGGMGPLLLGGLVVAGIVVAGVSLAGKKKGVK
jgi:hypothetical protein